MKRLFFLLFLVLARPAAAAAPPNVLFIMTDQQMADAMSFRQGDRYLRTPALDGLAAKGTYFSRAYAPNPLCMPARNSIFTGRFPHETQISDNADMRSGRTLDAGEFPTLGTYFEQVGYRTAYFGKWHLSYDAKKPETHGFQVLDTQQKDTVSADHAVAFLRAPQSKPFLLVVSFLNPHNIAEFTRGQPLSNGPIGQPPALAEQPPPPTNLGHPVGEPDTMKLIRQGYHANHRLFPVGNFSPSIWQAMRWGYYRLVEKVDAEIGRVLAALRENGLEQNTVIVFVSDHGECVGAHGLSQKTVFYEESVRVPLIISTPGPSRVRSDDRLINVGIDLLPTLLDYAGSKRPAKLTGASLRPLVEGRQVSTWTDEVISSNHMSQGGFVGDFVPITQGRMVRTERYKYCVYVHGEQRESLVDLINDPGEMVDLARDPGYRAVLLEHRERLRRFGREHNDELVETLLDQDVAPRAFERITTPPRGGAGGG